MAELQEWIARALKESESRLDGRIAALETSLGGAVSRTVAAETTESTLDCGPEGSSTAAAASASSGLALHASNDDGTSAGPGGSGAVVAPPRVAFDLTEGSDVEITPIEALVEDDAWVKSMMKDVRKQLDVTFVKDEKSENTRKMCRDSSRDSAACNRNSEAEVPSGNFKDHFRLQTRRPPGPEKADEKHHGWKRACRMACGPVLHPEKRFRSIWNVLLALLICYCGIAVPLEISFEQDMVESMCGSGLDKTPRNQCTSWIAWFWVNLIVDLWFIADIVVNCRTGYMLEGHFYNDDWLALKKYLQTGFMIDFCGSFPLNIILIAVDPNNPYGREYSDGGDAAEQDYTRLNRMLRILRMTKLFKLARMVSYATHCDSSPLLPRPTACARSDARVDLDLDLDLAIFLHPSVGNTRCVRVRARVMSMAMPCPIPLRQAQATDIHACSMRTS